MDEKACVTLCPKGKSPDSSGFCTPIPNFQLYKESLTSSFNLEDWTMIGVNERKMTYQAKPMIGMFKEMERARLTFGQLPAHSGVVVRFTIFAFNIWAQGEFIKAIIGTVHQTPSVKTISGFSNAYDNANCSSLEMIYCTSFVGEYQLSHTASYIDIEIMSDTYPNSQAKWGISDFSFDLVLCSLNCLECDDVAKCITCFEGHFAYKGICLEVYPFRSQLLEGRCIECDETSFYLEAAFGKQQSIISNGDQYTQQQNNGLFINHFRILGSVSKNLYIKRIYKNIKPHYGIRIMATLTFLNIQSAEFELLILIEKNTAINIKSDSSQILQTIELNETIEHNSTDFKIQFIQNSYNQAKFGISNFIILAEKCYPTCLICSGASKEQCTLWKLEPNFDQNTMKCDMQSYFSVDNDEYIQCQQSYCNKCLSQTKCIDCSQGYQLSGYECYWGQKYYWDNINQQCQQCYPSCLTCKGPYNVDCLDLQQTFGDCWDGIWTPGEQCDDGNAISRDGCSDCIIDDGWSCINVENEPSLCNQCIINCVSCMNSTECLQCQIGYYYQNGFCQKCQQDCNDFLNQSFCKQCIVNNYQPIDGKCPICDTDLGYYIINNKCQSKCEMVQLLMMKKNVMMVIQLISMVAINTVKWNLILVVIRLNVSKIQIHLHNQSMQIKLLIIYFIYNWKISIRYQFIKNIIELQICQCYH